MKTFECIRLDCEATVDMEKVEDMPDGWAAMLIQQRKPGTAELEQYQGIICRKHADEVKALIIRPEVT